MPDALKACTADTLIQHVKVHDTKMNNLLCSGLPTEHGFSASTHDDVTGMFIGGLRLDVMPVR